MTKIRLCHVHGGPVPDKQWCPDCLYDFEHRANADTLTPETRAAQLRLLDGPLEIPFSNLHQRVEELVGRPVFTHELANFDRLIDETLHRRPPPRGPADIIAQFQEDYPDKQIIVVQTPEAEA